MGALDLSAEEVLSAAVRVIRVCVLDGGCLMAFAESYFDETNTHKGDDRLCVGGYIFTKANAERQAAGWGEMLTKWGLPYFHKWGLPYFHMTDCAANEDKFKHLTGEECDLAAREAHRNNKGNRERRILHNRSRV